MLTVESAFRDGKAIRWSCTCDCGNRTSPFANNVRRGLTTSCGCLHIKAITKHGLTNHPLRKIWKGMIARCTIKTARGYSSYGGRGITICERWLESFDAFASDMGNRPTPKHTIDRINNEGGYEPENCRWATPSAQAWNRRDTKIFVIHGISETLGGWAGIAGVTRASIASWMRKRGLTAECAIRRYLSKLDPSLS